MNCKTFANFGWKDGIIVSPTSSIEVGTGNKKMFLRFRSGQEPFVHTGGRIFRAGVFREEGKPFPLLTSPQPGDDSAWLIRLITENPRDNVGGTGFVEVVKGDREKIFVLLGTKMAGCRAICKDALLIIKQGDLVKVTMSGRNKVQYALLLDKTNKPQMITWNHQLMKNAA